MTSLFGVMWDRPLAFSLFLLLLLGFIRRPPAALNLATSSVFAHIGKGWGWSRFLHLVRRLSAFVVFVGTVIVIAGPTAPTAHVEKKSGIDLVIALDLSTSMYALDMGVRSRNRRISLEEARQSTRIAAAQRVVEDFVGKRARDRVGLVVFSKEAFSQVPLTFDHDFLVQVLRRLRPGVIEDGTAIGNALLASTLRLEDSKAASKVVVLVTDGKNTAGNVEPLDAARAAAEAGVRVDTVLIGSEAPHVPVLVGIEEGEPQIVQARLESDPRLLGSIAALSGGEFYRAEDEEGLRRRFHEILDGLERREMEDQAQPRRGQDLSAGLTPALASFLVLWLLLGFALPERS